MKEDEIANLICSAQLEMIYFLWVNFFFSGEISCSLGCGGNVKMRGGE